MMLFLVISSPRSYVWATRGGVGTMNARSTLMYSVRGGVGQTSLWVSKVQDVGKLDLCNKAL